MPKSDKGESRMRRGLMESLGCELIWGIMPLFWRLLAALPALLVLAGRMVWAGIFAAVICRVVRRIRFLSLARSSRAVKTLTASGLLITVNWGLYIWATNSGYLLEASLGYYLSPLATIAMGMAFFHERLSNLQKIAFALAALGVGAFIAMEGGAVWIACIFALTFSAYSAVKKKGGYDALPGLAFESGVTAFIGVALFAIGLIWPGLWMLTPPADGAAASFSPEGYAALLAAAGLLTVIPMLLYSACANHIPLVIVGFMHYLSPTMTTLLAVFAFGEAFTLGHAVCFGLVWAGLAAVGVDAVRSLRGHAG